jgi:hypothetical protein
VRPWPAATQTVWTAAEVPPALASGAPLCLWRRGLAPALADALVWACARRAWDASCVLSARDPALRGLGRLVPPGVPRAPLCEDLRLLVRLLACGPRAPAALSVRLRTVACGPDALLAWEGEGAGLLCAYAGPALTLVTLPPDAAAPASAHLERCDVALVPGAPGAPVLLHASAPGRRLLLTVTAARPPADARTDAPSPSQPGAAPRPFAGRSVATSPAVPWSLTP